MQSKHIHSLHFAKRTHLSVYLRSVVGHKISSICLLRVTWKWLRIYPLTSIQIEIAKVRNQNCWPKLEFFKDSAGICTIFHSMFFVHILNEIDEWNDGKFVTLWTLEVKRWENKKNSDNIGRGHGTEGRKNSKIWLKNAIFSLTANYVDCEELPKTVPSPFESHDLSKRSILFGGFHLISTVSVLILTFNTQLWIPWGQQQILYEWKHL